MKNLNNSPFVEELFILLVDDNEALNFLHAKLCDLNLPEAEVKIVTNGELALEYLESNKSVLQNKEVLILLDIRMPVMDGWALLDEMKARNLGENYNVVMLTSSTSTTDKAQAMAYPFVMDYLEKPLRGFQLKDLAIELNRTPKKN